MKKHYLLMLFLLTGWGVGQAFGQTYLNFTVNQAPELVADAGIDGIICPGDSAVLGGNFPGDGGSPPYVYAWTPTTAVDDPTSGFPQASPTVNTTYTLMVTDSLNCTAFDSMFVEVDTCVGMEEIPEVEAFNLFPNPSNGRFMVELDGQTQDPLTLQVTDLSGRVLFEEKLSHLSGFQRKEIKLNGLATGSYFFVVELDGRRISRKIFIHQ